ncbi:hypothetical protein DsansV1_C06g0060131 [Dioscorea sansibarensis]
MSMNKRSVFAMAERQHYSDYGFDPQLGFSQILEEAMERGNKLGLQSPDTFQFKLQKPMMSTGEEEQEDSPGAKRKKKKKLGWWSWGLPSPFLFWKKNDDKHNNKKNNNNNNNNNNEKRSAPYCSSPSYFRSAMSGPLHMESSAPASNPRCNRARSGPLGGLQRRHGLSLVH